MSFIDCSLLSILNESTHCSINLTRECVGPIQDQVKQVWMDFYADESELHDLCMNVKCDLNRGKKCLMDAFNISMAAAVLAPEDCRRYGLCE